LRVQSQPKLVIVLNNLMSEGTPKMALDICRHCVREGVHPIVMTLDPEVDEIGSQFRALGATIEAARIRKGGKRWVVDLITETRRVVKRHKAKAVLSMPFGWHAFIGIGARLAGAGPVVAHVGNHPGGAPESTRRLLRWMVALGRPFTRSLACCSDYVRRGIVDLLGISRAQTTVIYNGAALDDYATRAQAVRERRRPGGRRRVVMVARYEVHKDQPSLIRAIGLLRDAGEEIELQLIGDGTRRPELERLVTELGLADRVDLAGFRDDVAEQLGAADLFVFATTPDEGLGIALIEAMAAGTPIVASDVGACRETLNGEECGLLVASHDPAALAAGIRNVLADPAAAQERAARAQTRAAALFSSRMMFEGYMKLLLPNVLQERRPAAGAPA